MPTFIPARGRTLHRAGVCVNRIGTVDCSGVGFAEQGLHFCEVLFNGIEIWRVGGQEKELGFGGADGCANGAALVAGEV